METKSWAVKYRPKRLNEVAGQAAVVNKLRGMLKTQEVPNALLFSAGTGKTTLARMVMRYLNCENGNACGKCESCRLDTDRHPDFMEINASERRGIDDVRAIIKQAQFRPQYNIRVILLDEAHNLTSHSANAFLKPLEEPPEHTLWILGTTDPQKLLPALIGRCEHLALTTLSKEDIASRLAAIASKESIDYATNDLYMEIASATGGHVRNAVNVLEGISKYVRGMKNPPSTEELVDKVMKEALQTTDVALENICAKTLLGMYLGKPNAIVAATLDLDQASFIQYANRMLWLNQYLIDVQVRDNHQNIWHTADNRRFRSVVDKKISVDLSMLLNVHRKLVSFKEKLLNFSVAERSLAVVILTS